MSLSNISSSHPLANPPSALQASTINASAEITPVNSGATGDRLLLNLYANGIRQAAVTGTASSEVVKGIPADSKFGEWWQQLSNATQSPVFQEWAQSKNIDTSKPININPLAETLTVTINGERVELKGTEQDRGWRGATGPIMASAKAVGGYTFDAPTNPQEAPLIAVARFHGEFLLPHMKEETLARATQLEHNQAFDVLGPDSYVDVQAQSPEVLRQQKYELGDSINTFTLSKKLQELQQVRRENPTHWHGTLADALDTRIPIHADSRIAQETQKKDASLKAVLSAAGWDLPENEDELDNHISALAAPALPAPKEGNFGGALAWPVPLSVEDQAELFRIVVDNQPPVPGLDNNSGLGSADILGALMKEVPRTILNQRDPMAIMQSILNSSGAHSVGQALKERMGEVAANSTSQEILLTALGVTLNAKSLGDSDPNLVAGFDLASPEHHGQHVSVIHQRLINHLASTQVTTAEAAPVAAMLLLSRAAPELLIKDIPPNVTYGSIPWLALKAAAGRIEETSPGAVARMSFAEVVAFDSIDPVTEQGREIQARTALPAIIDWGKANGELHGQGPYSDEQLASIRQAITAKQDDLLNASNSIRDASSPPTQRSVALAELKTRLKTQFGWNIPLEEKSIRSQSARRNDGLSPSISLDPQGSYSLLDLYLSKKAGLKVDWQSTNTNITPAVIAAIETLPDPIKAHNKAFDDYSNNLSKAWSTVTKSAIADLPLEDRKHIEWGELKVFERGSLVRTEVTTPNGAHTSEQFTPTDNSLIIEAKLNGKTTYYEFDPAGEGIRRRDDWKDSFKEGRQGPEVKGQGPLSEHFTAPVIQPLQPTTSDDGSSLKAGDVETAPPKSYSSPRSEYLGKLLSEKIVSVYRLGERKDSTREVTTFDEEENQKNLFRGIALAPIPGGSALWNLSQGKYLDAVGDVIFDGVMYLVTLGVGKAGSSVKSGASNSVSRKPFGKLFNSTKSLAHLDDTIRAVNDGKNLATRGVNQFKKLAGTADDINLIKVANKHDIAVGTYQSGNGAPPLTGPAQFDQGTGKWTAYDPRKNEVYGRPLDDFTPETAKYGNELGASDDVGEVVLRRKRPNHLERGLANDNVIHMGREIKDFKVLGDGIFTYVDKYKGVERLNICAHGVNPNYKQLLTDEPMRMFYNGKSHSPAELLETLKEAGIKPENFNNARLLMCHSANGSVNSFGSQFAKLIQRDVKAFQGPVRAHVIPENVDELKVSLGTKYPQYSESEVSRQIHNQLQLNLALGTNKVGPNKISGGADIPLFYRPVKFAPK